MGEINYSQYIQQWSGLLNSVASSYHIPGYEYQDILQESQIILCKILQHKKYDPQRSSFYTFLKKSITNELSKINQHMYRQKSIQLCTGTMSNPIFIETISYEMDIEDKIYFDQLLDIVRNKYDGVIADILLLRLEKYKDTEVCDIINQEHGTHYTRHSLQMMLRRELPKVVSVLKKHGAF